MSNFGVRTEHADYTKRKSQWVLMRDVMEGADAIKDKGTEYLPAPSSQNLIMDPYEKNRYNAFKQRATFSNYTAQIKDCLHGIAESKPALISVPAELTVTKILDNIDYQGDSIEQFCSDCLSDLLDTGFGGILIDYPNVSKEMSVAQAEKEKLHPYFAYYKAESIINWKTTIIQGVKRLSLVVLKEDVLSPDADEFGHETIEQYRVLRLNRAGHFEVQIYSTYKDNDTRQENVAPGMAKEILIKGEPIDYIPFIMLPFNGPVKPLLYDIAQLNIAHYQTTADYQNGVHLTTRPTGYFTGHKAEVDAEGNIVPICVGADVFWQIEEPDAKVGTCTFAGEGLQHCEASLDRIEGQILTLSSHIISAEKKTAENKESMKIHRQGEDAKLATYVRYLSKRFTDALKIVCDWLDIPSDDVSFILNSDFSTLVFDANALNSIANIFSQGKFPLRSLYYLLQQGGFLEPDMTYESFIYLLDLEHTELSPEEVNAAYKAFRKDGKKLNIAPEDYYSPGVMRDNDKNNDKSIITTDGEE